MDPSVLQGFNPVISFPLAFFLILLSFAAAWWSYTYLRDIPALKKYTLILLRGSALTLLVFLLLNPFSSIQIPTDESRSVAVYIDNSQSLTVNRGDYQGDTSYREILSELENETGDSFDITYFRFDNDIYPGRELTLDGSATNLFGVYEHFRENENRYLASVLLSDGIVTQGRNPVFTVENLSKPLITIPVGDTTDVRDIAISTIDAPDRMYTFTTRMISLEISQQGFEGSETRLTVNRDGEFLTSETISFHAEQTSHTVEFEAEFTEPGLYTFEAIIPHTDGEFTYQNNRRTFSIEVTEDKTEIVSLAFEVHPDVASVRRLIASDQQYNLISSTYLSQSQVIGTQIGDLPAVPDLVVVHGLPSDPLPALDWLADTPAPILFMALPSSYESRLWPERLQDVMPYTMGEGSTIQHVQLQSFLSGGSRHPILNLPSDGLNRFPLLSSAHSEYTTSPLSSVLMHTGTQGESLTIPLLVVEEPGSKRVAALNAFNWFRYENNRSEEIRTFFETFFTNIISWTASSPDHENLVIEPVRDSFNENEAIQIRADLVNELGNPEPGATIEIQIFEQLSVSPVRTFTMSHEQNGRYLTEAGNLPAGDYRVSGRATIEDRELGTDQTAFSVGDSVIEFLDTKRNDAMLASLAERSDGIFLKDYRWERLTDFLQERVTLEAEAGMTTRTDYFYRSYLWFIVILVLLSAEWLLRRNLSLP